MQPINWPDRQRSGQCYYRELECPERRLASIRPAVHRLSQWLLLSC